MDIRTKLVFAQVSVSLVSMLALGFAMFGSVEVEAPAGTMWNEVTDCMTQDGWVFVDPACVTNSTDPDCLIELCGAACDALRQTGSADIKYICGVG